MLIRSELCEDNITKPVHERNQSCDWQTARAANARYVTGSHIKKAVSFWLDCYRGSVLWLERGVHCTAGKPSACNTAEAPTNVVTLRRARIVACVWHVGLQSGKLAPHGIIHEAHYCDT
jgi:hypothetical protein